MFDRMTDRVCLCLEHSRQIAGEGHYGAVECEHLLMGLLKEGGGIACAVFRSAEIDLDALLEEIGRRSPPAGAPSDEKLEFSEAANRALDYAQEEGERFGHGYIGTEHLLLGILRERDGIVSQILTGMDLGLERARRMVLSFVQPTEKASDPAGHSDSPAAPPADQGEEKQEAPPPAKSGPSKPEEQVFVHATQRVQQCLEAARLEARRLNHDFIGTEHLLLGMLRDEGGVACSVLKKLGCDFHEMREEIVSLSPPGDSPIKGAASFSENSRQVLEMSMREARTMEHNYVGTEHLLLGLVCVEEGLAAQALLAQGIDYEGLRAELLRVLGLESFPSMPDIEEGEESKFELEDDDLEEAGALGAMPELAGASNDPPDDDQREAGSGTKVKTSYNSESAELVSRIQVLEAEKEEAVKEERFERAGELRDKVIELTLELERTLKGSHTVTHTFDDETVRAILDLMDQYWLMKSEGVERTNIVDWLKVNFFKLPGFVVPARPKRAEPEPEEE